ncbi:MAG: hypothetical protein M3383_01185 [Actinomycetota bacterium]|nr:hypothetical protein [Actinomycetota bacterium]
MVFDFELPEDAPKELRDDPAGVLRELAERDSAQPERRCACDVYAETLAEIGQLLWVTGSLLGPDRPEGTSPFGFGDDDIVGLATVCQIGAELARGAIDLLEDGNVYASQALVRQLVEVEYLALAFAKEDSIAREWIRADRPDRLNFWSPTELRKRSDGAFLRGDYWAHCERGGHPTPVALQLLPDHDQSPVVFEWVDLSGHLFSLWSSVATAILVRKDRLPEEATASFDRVAEAQSQWLEADEMTMVVRAMHQFGRRGPTD